MERKEAKVKLDQIIGNNIRRQRVARGMTLEDLSILIGYSAPYIRMIEKGLRGASIVTMLKLAQAFDMSLDTLASPPKSFRRGAATDDSNQVDQVLRDKIQALSTSLNTSELNFVIECVRCVKGFRNSR